ncbi:Putative FMN-binding split barrel [Septoria linicola]|uniref:FMN-binding split barrel n=1 Tax=Septoria linicola TaxID=215465 RepID=A0A9Q9AXM2_9PEZI|nr:putative FMN-binding split barrel [Septoria linicola]USW56934.1 Putative FMN-binding split barrel [Septoria linicola]
MVKYWDHISKDHEEWALRQSIFFIASAPLTGKHINCSPKGRPSATLTVFNENLVGYMDASGSGIETVSHMYENGRATIMFCSFDSSPRIMRWFCKGRAIETDHPEYENWLKRMGKTEYPALRAIIVLKVFKVQTSCGFAVPLLSHYDDPVKGPRGRFVDRKTLDNFAIKSAAHPGGMDAYRAKMNPKSLDGLPGLRRAMKTNGENVLVQETLWWLKQTSSQWQAMLLGAFLAVVCMLSVQAVLGQLDLRLPGRITI